MSALAKFFMLMAIIVILSYIIPMFLPHQSPFVQALLVGAAAAAIDVWLVDRRTTTTYKKANVVYKAI